MKIFSIKNNKQKGYALLFTIMIISVISVITAGLLKSTTNQLILSSLAQDSQSAFYQADTAGDCALYADRKNPSDITTTGGDWSCGGADLIVTNTGNGYTIYPTSSATSSFNPCFRIDVTRADNDLGYGRIERNTKISAKGYNICNLSNLKTVERKIEINYKEEI